jgi:signal transduction histidine kinase
MNHDPKSGSTNRRSRASVRDGVRVERRSRRLASRFNRRVGSVSKGVATIILTGFVVAITLGLCWALGAADLALFNWQVAISAASIATVIAAPIIYYAQAIIRELAASRRSLSMMTEQLAVAFHNAEEANAAKSRFLANMSHELRTPLNAVIGFSDIMQNQRFGPIANGRYVEYSRDINASGMHLLAIINDILDLAKIESGQSNIENESDFDVVELVNSTCTMLRPLVARQNVVLVVETPEKTINLCAVERMIRQILINIVSNAVKYTAACGTVKINFDCRADGSLAIIVKDSGIGMTLEEVRVALTPFGQVSNDLPNVPQGTGLGLPLAKAMVDMHDGEFTMRSQPGEGTTVSLIFPSNRVTICQDPSLADSALSA